MILFDRRRSLERTEAAQIDGVAGESLTVVSDAVQAQLALGNAMRRALALVAFGARTPPTSDPPTTSAPEPIVERVPAGTQDCLESCPTFPKDRCAEWLARFGPLASD